MDIPHMKLVQNVVSEYGIVKDNLHKKATMHHLSCVKEVQD